MSPAVPDATARRSARRVAFTLVELLVVIAIIGILVALLLPAVQAARAAARRTQCQNTLKQVGLALMNYESTNKRLPAGALHRDVYSNSNRTDFLGNSPNWRGAWVVQTLPYMEEQSLYDRYDLDLSVYAPVNAQVTITPVLALRCPEDQNSALNFLSPNSTTGNTSGDFAKGNYAACFNRDDYFSMGDHLETEFRSAFNPVAQYGARLGEITDGTSKTVLVAEILTLPSTGDVRGAWGHPAGCGFVSDKDERPTDRRYLNAAIMTPNANAQDLLRQDKPTYCDGDLDSGFASDSNLRCSDPLQIAEANIGSRSNHTGGVHVCLADGSVQFIKNEIDRLNWGWMLSIGEGNVALPE